MMISSFLLLLLLAPLSKGNKIDLFNQKHENATDIIIEGDIKATWDTIAMRYSPEYALRIGLVPPANQPLGTDGRPQDGTLSPEYTDYYWYNDFRPQTEIWRVDVFISPGVFDAEETKIIKSSLASLYKLTGVIKANFLQQRPVDNRNFIEIIKDGGCWSYVGRIYYFTDGQQLSLDDGCVYKDTVQHEFLHALGFEHEQSRPDRDDYVTINYENISPNNVHNFEKSSDVDSLGSPYDYKSVMHYHEYAFSINGEKTIDTRGNELSSLDRVSAKDRVQVRLMYQCTDGPRTLAQYRAEMCNTTNCKCGINMKGCQGDDNKCKGSLVCINNKCKRPRRRRKLLNRLRSAQKNTSGLDQ